MFIKHFEDIAGYRRGYLFEIPGVFRLLKYKVSKIMEKDDWLIVIAIFGKEFVIH